MLRKQDPNTGKKIALGAAIAGIGGYLAGLLTAPQSGSKTRADLADKAVDIKDETTQQLQMAADELGETIKEAQIKTMELKDKAREEFHEALIRAKDAQNKTKVVLKAFKDGASDDPELNRAVKQTKQAQKNLSKFLKS